MRILKSRKRIGMIPPDSSFYGLSRDDFATHLRIRKYGEFVLTRAVSPSYDLKVVPVSGFRRSAQNLGGKKRPVMLISASEEVLLDLFFRLAGLLGSTADVYLETKHKKYDNGLAEHILEPNGFSHRQILVSKDAMDTTAVLSILAEFGDSLLNDGALGVALVSNEGLPELHLDDHKVLIFYEWKRIGREVLDVLADYGIAQNNAMEALCDTEHVHTTNCDFYRQFRRLANRIGMERYKS